MKITYIGHATLLLEIGGAAILTDPNFDPRLGRLLPRVSSPGIALEDLPALDAILLTHAHADHLSFSTLQRLRPSVPILAPPVIARWLRKLGYKTAVDLKPGTSERIANVTIHAEIATHHGSRYVVDRWRSAANMYLLDAGETIFFAGDTALRPHTHALVQRVLWDSDRTLDLALLPIGYAPWWKPGFRKGHLTPDDALELFERLRARVLVPYHWGTFRHVTSTAYDAIRRLRLRLESHHRTADVHILEPGHSLQLEPEPSAR